MAADLILIDVEDGIKRVMNNSKLYVKLLGKFKEDTNLNDLTAAIAEGNLENARNKAHTLKGLAANLSLIELQKQALEIESQLKEGVVEQSKLDEVRNIYNITIEQVDKVIEKYV